ncbi:MAG: signal peptidase II [Planctomycetes bacterium]|nr:signal peptidase II [Planctomycetota bacterium]
MFLTLAVCGCAADLLTKHYIFEWRGMPQPDNVWWIVEDYFGIETALNPGALFGMGKGFGVVFAALSVAATAGVLGWIFIGRATRDLTLTIALGCVQGGILGNLYDRLGLWHPPGRPDVWRNEVRDWILFRWGEYTWPNFNIADSLLVCGAMLLLWHSFRNPEPPQEGK